MAFSTDAKNAAVDAVAERGKYISLHSDDPGTDGSHEIDVDREKTDWPDASDGKSTGDQVKFKDAPAEHYKYFGVWSEDEDGDFIHGNKLNPSVKLDDQGEIDVTPSIRWPDDDESDSD